MKRMLLKVAVVLAASSVSLQAAAIYTNGGFESGDFTGWTTGAGINNGLTGSPPFSSSSINIGAGGTFRSVVVTGGPELANAPITLPHVGGHTARVNNDVTGGIANFISQTDTITNADRDSGDGKLHVRFDYAVVLENPSHTANNQPFFFVRVRDVTASTTLFEDFSFAGQTGTLFQLVPSPTGGRAYSYLDWRHADVIIPDASNGHSIEVYLLASDCQPAGHSGYAYLDGFGSAIVVPPPSATPTAAPALGQGALVALGLLMMGAAVFTVRRF